MVLLYQLQAAEARINEANPGFSVEREQKGSMEVPLQEIFSERQKYGRVARYELRPGHHSQTTTSAFQLGEHKRNPRQAPDFPVVGRIIAFVNFPMRVLLFFFVSSWQCQVSFQHWKEFFFIMKKNSQDISPFKSLFWSDINFDKLNQTEFIDWQNLEEDSRMIIEDLLVRCFVIVSNYNV